MQEMIKERERAELFTVRRRSDFLSSAAPYLHKPVLWKAAGAETDQPQNSPLLVRSLNSNLHSVKSNIWLPDCTVHSLYCTALPLCVIPTADYFQMASSCFAGFGLQPLKKKMYLYL